MRREGISITAFARKDGCDEKLVRRGIEQGKLIAYDDGSLNPVLAGTPWRKGKIEPNSEGMVSYAEAQRRKENYLALLRQLEFEVKSGRLIDADAVQTESFNQARQERDALMNWPSRVSPLIAAELGCDQVKLAVVLEKYVREFLSERSGLFRTGEGDSSARMEAGAQA